MVNRNYRALQMKTKPAPNLSITNLGPSKRRSPIELTQAQRYVDDTTRISFNPIIRAKAQPISPEPLGFELAGPREFIFHDPALVHAGIVTCGGLCPGLNAVIRGLVMQLWHRYGVRKITGIRYGYQGLANTSSENFVDLSPQSVVNIHEQGGTILGSSRGAPTIEQMAQTINSKGFRMLFVIGGDGTMRGANKLAAELRRSNTPVGIIGIPKTIDNDIPFVRRSFGFETAVERACEAVFCAHEEARGARNGIGLVKLMGRNSGYIAANATLATGHVNFCLVPEVPFTLEGERGLFAMVAKRIRDSGHAVIAVAEGAGQKFFASNDLRDDSGNAKLHDIGMFLKEKLGQELAARNIAYSLKYIDPSYLIRSAPANPNDRLFCARLAQNAVHAAMAGKTGMLIGLWHGVMTHVPFTALEGSTQAIDPGGELWFNVLEMTGQPALMQ